MVEGKSNPAQLGVEDYYSVNTTLHYQEYSTVFTLYQSCTPWCAGLDLLSIHTAFQGVQGCVYYSYWFHYEHNTPIYTNVYQYILHVLLFSL